MPKSQEELNKLRLSKQLNSDLIEEVKSDAPDLNRINALLNDGADLNCKGSRPFWWAVKKRHAELILKFIDYGALNVPIARKFLGNMCDFKGFDDAAEAVFFELVDYAAGVTGFCDDYVGPYINNVLITGRLDKIEDLKKRYDLNDSYIAAAVPARIIFELIRNGQQKAYGYIDGIKDWADKAAFDTAIAGGEAEALSRIIDKGRYFEPSRAAVCQAVFNGYTDVLDILTVCGYDFEGHAEIFLEKACRACASVGTVPIRYLLENGYSLLDAYRGKTVTEHAVIDNNAALMDFLRENQKTGA